MRKKKLLFIGFVIIIISLQDYAQTLTDIDGNIYHTVTIGAQIWMLENLKTTKFNDGAAIPNVTDTIAWASLTTPGSCAYNNTTNADTINTYGRLYNWYTVNTGKLCPTGWHVPADAEWTTLTSYVGGETAGSKLKEAGNAHWQHSPFDSIATNSSGFTGLPGGLRSTTDIGTKCVGDYRGIGQYGNWWRDTEVDMSNALEFALDCFGNHVTRQSANKTYGFSVRCLNDTAASIGIANEVGIEGIETYPNPANKKLFIKNIMAANSFIYIFNLQGEQIFFKQDVSNNIDISNLKNGVYILKIIDSGKIRITKFIKE